ncbi:MAG: 3-deoxy-7-phosphoheptulonate synthase [Clostridia bacterium]|nr:3-deoxy-7-phosphoheptulonate synthase [Deltaproteobacteria bacterium]
MSWTTESWQSKQTTNPYGDAEALKTAKAKLASLPPLVTSWEIERLRDLTAEAQDGKRLWLQGGDCAESLADCTSEVIASKLKILLQMSLVLLDATKKPVIRVGRLAGQYAKPRSNPMETKVVDGRAVELPAYQGDLLNATPFTPEARIPNPQRLIDGYQHAAMTLNFVRSLVQGGFADPHHPENWELGDRALELEPSLRDAYMHSRENLRRVLDLAKALDVPDSAALTAVEFYVSHEGLNLHYEAAQTRRVPRRDGYYNLTTHFPWIGERTRQLDGAHIEYFRGIVNPIGIKLGPSVTADTALNLIDVLNPTNASGKIVLISRLGARKINDVLPSLVRAIDKSKRRVLWVCDPMHGNTRSTQSGVKTRDVSDVLSEVRSAIAVHREAGTVFGGVHVELTGENVTECVGGSMALSDSDLARSYTSLCDPRLNYGQALELAVDMAKTLTGR